MTYQEYKKYQEMEKLESHITKKCGKDICNLILNYYNDLDILSKSDIYLENNLYKWKISTNEGSTLVFTKFNKSNKTWYTDCLTFHIGNI